MHAYAFILSFSTFIH
jgi:hypothetical protein